MIRMMMMMMIIIIIIIIYNSYKVVPAGIT